jgi:hypothetical protein
LVQEVSEALTRKTEATVWSVMAQNISPYKGISLINDPIHGYMQYTTHTEDRKLTETVVSG